MAAIIETNPFAIDRPPVANNRGLNQPHNAFGDSASSSARANSGAGDSQTAARPTLMRKAEGHTDRVTAVILLQHDDGLITVSEDRSLRVWQLRDTGTYWPSICHYCVSPLLCADYNEQTRRLLVGALNGTITEFTIADDANSLRTAREYFTHQNGVNCVRLELACEWVLSAGKDRRVVWQCSETGRNVGSYTCESSVLALQFDAPARMAFAGDFSGHIYVLKITGASGELVSKLSAHTGSVRSLAWDMDRQWLFSGAYDGLIIVWDIGGRQGSAYELNGHTTKVTAITYSQSTQRLYSFDDAGSAQAWDVRVRRDMTPEWTSSDTCQRCDAPFFWNVREMWQRKTVGLRQHHCRLCGSAVCDTCSQHRTRHPPMGYELAVRMCDQCARQRQQQETDNPATFAQSQRPLAVPFDVSGLGVVAVYIDEIRRHLATVGNDRVVKVWDLQPMLS